MKKMCTGLLSVFSQTNKKTSKSVYTSVWYLYQVCGMYDSISYNYDTERSPRHRGTAACILRHASDMEFGRSES